VDLRILIFEDDPLLVSVYREFLEGDGHVVGAATGLVSALRLAARGEWDVCIADSSPHSNSKLNDDDRALFAALARTAPVIVTTGRAWARDVDPRELGAATILSKPFDFDTLLAALVSAEAMGKAAAQ
jgi:DNA-binding response OmpR family regulator